METTTQEHQSGFGEENTPLAVENVKAQADFIQELMKTVMKPDVHYGVITGFGNKPTLYKPGAEKILTAFKIAVRPVVCDLSNDDEIRYHKRMLMYTGVSMSIGGICLLFHCWHKETLYI